MLASNMLSFFIAAATLPIVLMEPQHRNRLRTGLRPGGLISTKMTEPFRKMWHDMRMRPGRGKPSPDEITVKEFQRALLKAKEGFIELGFKEAAIHVDKNAKSLSTCHRFDQGGSVETCLKEEEERLKITGQGQLQDKDAMKAAKLPDPSPSMGTGWLVRILGFLAETYQQASRGQPMKDAAVSVYDRRIAPAFGKDLKDSMINSLIRSKLVGSFPNPDEEDQFFARFGGTQQARVDMEEFAQDVLPLIDGIFDSIVKHNLDDTKSPLRHYSDRYKAVLHLTRRLSADPVALVLVVLLASCLVLSSWKKCRSKLRVTSQTACALEPNPPLCTQLNVEICDSNPEALSK